MKTIAEMVKTLDEVMIKEWEEYNPSELNDVILGLIMNHEVYTDIQPYYIDYLIQDLEDLRDEIKK
jgi:hypothetical protein